MTPTTRRKRKAKPRRTAERAGKSRRPPWPQVAPASPAPGPAFAADFAAQVAARSVGKKKPLVRRNIAERRERARVRRNAARCSVKFLEFAKSAVPLASYAAGAAVRGKELLGYATRVVRFPVERADRRIRSSNSEGVNRRRKISMIYTGRALPCGFSSESLGQRKIDFVSLINMTLSLLILRILVR